MLKRFPKILLSIMTIGYIFAFFGLITPGMFLYGLIGLAVGGTLTILNVTSSEYRATKALNASRKFIEKENVEKAVSMVLTSVSLYNNEETVYTFFSKPFKNKKALNGVAKKLYSLLKDNDTPYFRYVVSCFLYAAGDVKKIVPLLEEIPEEKRTIKMARLLGSVLVDLQDFDRAVEVFKEFDPPYIPIIEDELAIVYGIGVSYLAMGNKEKGIEYLTRVEARSPRFGNVAKILDELEKSE